MTLISLIIILSCLTSLFLWSSHFFKTHSNSTAIFIVSAQLIVLNKNFDSPRTVATRRNFFDAIATSDT